MVEMALLTTAECVAVLSIARFEEKGNDSSLELRMRTTAGNILGKESVPENTNTVLALEHQQANDPEPKQVYWG